MTIEELEIVIEAQTREFNQQIANVTRQVSSMEKQVNKSLGNIKNIFGRVGKWIAALGIGKVIKDSIITAMDSIESDSMFDTVFGSLANDVRQWSEELQNTLGLNGYAIRENVATLYNMTQSMGLASSEALNLSKDMTLLAEDMASFYNISGDEAFNKIRAGLTGETEPLKALGILVDDATIKQYAYANGIATTGSELSNTEKVMARYIAIQQQTATASGDLARTINSPANQLRVLQNNLNLLKIELGNAFMPIVQVVLPILNSFAQALVKVTSVVARFMNALFGTSASSSAGSTTSAIGGVSTAVNGVSDAYNNAGKSAKKATKDAKGFLAGFDEINKVNQNSSDSDSGSGSSGGGSAGGVDIPIFNIEEQEGALTQLTGKVEEFALKVRNAFISIANFIKKHKEIIISLVSGLVVGIIGVFIAANWGTIVSTISGIFIPLITWFKNLALAMEFSTPLKVFSYGLFGISPVALGVVAAIAAATAAIVYLWQTSDSFRQALIDGWNALISALTPYWEAIKRALLLIGDILITVLTPILLVLRDAWCTVVDNIVKITMSLWTNCIAPVVKFLGECLKKIIDGLSEIWEAWKPTIEKIMGVVMLVWDTCLKPFVNWLGSTFIQAFKNIGDYIKPILDSLKTMFSGLIDFIVGVLTGNWQKAWQGIVDIFRGIFNGIEAIAKKPINAIIKAINSMIGGLNKIKLPDWVPGFGGMGINIPKIPMLAQGGIVDKATLSIVGEQGSEAVVPLKNNTEWMDTLRGIMTSAFMQAMQGGVRSSNESYGVGDLILQIDGSIIGKVALNQLKKMQRQGGITLIPV
ncbi:hypothetical protein [Clostridium sp. 1001271B_151109_B4]|uniref:phage tail protein n=1 Tax=Clostridium sp. 1001271B_151109_B4 TaxID=2787148 RepID=UPI0018AA5075|nr:hypothetical protein [Clostridium sp. 1001271B_151109_B4]